MVDYYVTNFGRHEISKEVYDLLVKVKNGDKLTPEERKLIKCNCCIKFAGRIPDHEICHGFEPVKPRSSMDGFY